MLTKLRLLSLKALLLSLPLLAGCAASSPSAPQAAATTAASRRPAEDLSRYRPVFAAPPAPGAPPQAVAPTAKAAAPAPTNQLNAQLDQRLRDQAYANQRIRYASGYRIRVYLGLEREQVMSIRRQIISHYPEETDYITFKQPVYRLYIGDYTSRLDAARGLARVRQLAPRAELEAMSVLLRKTP